MYDETAMKGAAQCNDYFVLFFGKLRAAHEASLAVDDFDLDDGPTSRAMFFELRTKEKEAVTALVEHCRTHADAILADNYFGPTFLRDLEPETV